MINLSFEIPAPGSPWRTTWDDRIQADPKLVGEMDLRYKLFGVNVEMTIDDIEIISKKKFVTLVDLALSISHATRRLSSGEDAAFGFTESAEVIRLHQDGDLISVSSSKHSWQVSLEREELMEALTEFLREAHSRLTEHLPELAENPVIQRFSPK